MAAITMTTSTRQARWAHVSRPPHTEPTHGAGHHDRPGKPGKPTSEGYWVEWSPDTPEANTGYDAELHLPPGAYILTATANVRLASEATGPSEVECSLFVGEKNVSLHQLRMPPGDVTTLAATAHAELSETTTIQWVCGSTTGPWYVDLAVTAVKVDILHYIG